MKRIMILLIALTMVISFTSCAKKDSQVDANTQKSDAEKQVDKDSIILPDVVTGTISFNDLDSIRFEIYPNYARQSVLNFIYLVNSGHYNGVIIDSIEKDYVCTAGKYESGFRPRETDFEYSIVGEFADNGIENPLHHTAGSLSWLHTADDNDSACTEFCLYLSSEKTWDLDGKYAAFGTVIGDDSFKVLEKINKRKTNKSNIPKKELMITAIILDPISQEGFDADFKFPEPNFIMKNKSDSAK